jgi:hypothetical protein
VPAPGAGRPGAPGRRPRRRNQARGRGSPRGLAGRRGGGRQNVSGPVSQNSPVAGELGWQQRHRTTRREGLGQPRTPSPMAGSSAAPGSAPSTFAIAFLKALHPEQKARIAKMRRIFAGEYLTANASEARGSDSPSRGQLDRSAAAPSRRRRNRRPAGQFRHKPIQASIVAHHYIDKER